MIETKKAFLIRKVEPGIVINEQKVHFSILFIIKSIEPLEAFGIDLVQGKLCVTYYK